jgi:hypothetical protein
VEDFGGMAFGSDEGPDGFDFASFADEEGAADDAHVGAAHEMFFLPGAELLDGFVGGVAEQGEIEILLGLEGGLGFDRIGAQAEDGDAELVEIFFCVAKLGRFDGSTGSAGFGVEEKEDALAGEVFERDGGAFVGLKAEGGGFGADFGHKKFLASWVQQLNRERADGLRRPSLQLRRSIRRDVSARARNLAGNACELLGAD